MTANKLYDKYFDWMCQLVDDDTYTNGRSYLDLFYLLNDIPFTYLLEMDANRLEDGLYLRYRFGKEIGYQEATIDRYFYRKDCSVFEMMVALAIRLEEHIMDDPEIGNRTDKWFWDMIESMGLQDMNDDQFDEGYAYDVIWRFLDRDYEPNGKGGLFTIKNPKYDLRDVEIWYQACWYLNELK